MVSARRWLQPVDPLSAMQLLRDVAFSFESYRLLAVARELGLHVRSGFTRYQYDAMIATVLDRVEQDLEDGSLLAFEAVRPTIGPTHASRPVMPERSVDRPQTFRSALAINAVDENGAPIADADVALAMSNVGLTKQDGFHVQGKLDPSTYDVEVRKAGFSAGTASVVVGDDETVIVKVQLTKLRARLVWPINGADHKQYVNLDPVATAPEQGNRIKVRFKLQGGKAGDKAYFKLEYDAAKVSKRNSPARAVVGGVQVSWCPQGGKEFTLRVENEELVAEVELGLAGGDTFTISVGGTPDCADERCKSPTGASSGTRSWPRPS